MPAPMVTGDIEAGHLVELDLSDWWAATYPLRVLHRIDSPPGPAAHWLIERFRSQM
jgi:hypothetical protein